MDHPYWNEAADALDTILDAMPHLQARVDPETTRLAILGFDCALFPSERRAHLQELQKLVCGWKPKVFEVVLHTSYTRCQRKQRQAT